MLILSPAHKLADIKREYAARKGENNSDNDLLKKDTTYLRLIKQKAFLQSRIAMAETDSIYLTLNLSDSSANLEISGVIVHAAKMRQFSASSILRGGNDNAIMALFSTPMTISKSLATIKKEPVMIKMAPKDTTEYKPDIMPDTSMVENVFFILEMSNGIRIFVYQQEDDKLGKGMSEMKFDLTDRINNTVKDIKSVAALKVPKYHPFIKIRLPRADAKIIYRAIPRHGQIGVYF